MLSGNNSIIEQAVNTKTKTDVAQEKEILKQATVAAMGKSKYGNVEKKYLDVELDKTPGSENYSSKKITKGIRVTFTSSGRSYLIDSDGNVEIKEPAVLPDGIQIGSIVTYAPEGSTYKWQGKYATADTITTIDGVDTTAYDVELDSTSSGADRITSWKVLKIDEEEEEIQLVPTETKTQILLNGAPGYNNAIQLLDAACSALYSDHSKGIIAKSINIDDIESLLDETKLQTEKDSYKHNNNRYSFLDENDQISTPYSKNCSYFPRIYEEEINSVINGTKKTNGLGLSSAGSKLYERDETTSLTLQTTATNATKGYFQANSCIKPYQTYYYYSLKTSGNYKECGSEYASMLNKTFWIASRCVDTNSSYCSFYICGVNNGNLNEADNGFCSWISVSPGNNQRALFPVISISFDLIEPDGSNYKVK